VPFSSEPSYYYLRIIGSGSAGQSFIVDAVQLETGSIATEMKSWSFRDGRFWIGLSATIEESLNLVQAQSTTWSFDVINGRWSIGAATDYLSIPIALPALSKLEEVRILGIAGTTGSSVTIRKMKKGEMAGSDISTTAGTLPTGTPGWVAVTPLTNEKMCQAGDYFYLTVYSSGTATDIIYNGYFKYTRCVI
jgi:hypothetical protein